MIRYAWLTYRRELLWFPGALLGFFVVMAWIMRHPDVRFAIARGYLGFFVPLVAGILAAYSVLDDPALELRFSTPLRPSQILVGRLLLVLAVQTAGAFVFQLLALGMGVDFSPLGSILAVQRAWIVPTLALAAIGVTGSLAAAQCATGAFLAGAVWLVQLLMKGWLLANGRHLYLFMGVLEPHHPDLLASQGAVLAASLVLLTFGWALLHRRERYL